MTEQELSLLVNTKLDQLNQDMVLYNYAIDHYRESRWTVEDNCKIAHNLELTKYLISSLETFRELPNYYRVLFMPEAELDKEIIPSNFKAIKAALSKKAKTEKLISPEIIEDPIKANKIIKIIEDWKISKSKGVDDVEKIIFREVPDELKRIMIEHGIGYLNFGTVWDLKELLVDVENFEIKFKKAKTIFEKEYNDDILNRLNIYFSVLNKDYNFSEDKIITKEEIDCLRGYADKIPYSLKFLEYINSQISKDFCAPLVSTTIIKMLQSKEFLYLLKDGEAQKTANLFLKSSKVFLEESTEVYKNIPAPYSNNFKENRIKLDFDTGKINYNRSVDIDEVSRILNEIENKYATPRDTFVNALECLYELIKVRDKSKKRSSNFILLNNNINENVLRIYEAIKNWYENFITYIGSPILGIKDPVYMKYNILRNKEKMLMNINDSEKSILKLKDVITKYINIFSNIDSEIKEVIDPDFELSSLPDSIYKENGVRNYLYGSYANSKTVEMIEFIKNEAQRQSNEKTNLELNKDNQKQKRDN